MTRQKFLVFMIILSFLMTITGVYAKGQDEEKLVIGMSSPALNEFYYHLEDFAKRGAQELGVELVVLNAEDKDEKQIADVEDLIARGVDGMIVLPVTSAVAKTIFEKLEKAKIPYIDADRNPGIEPQEEYPHYLAFVGPDNVDAAYRIAKYLIEHMSAGKDGVKSIVALEGRLGSTNSELRTKGLMKALAEHPDVKLLAKQTAGFDRDKGMTVMEDFLVAYHDIDAVWSANDAMALGAVSAIKSAGRLDEMIVGGMDADKDACEAVARGELSYTEGGHWLVGGFAFVMLYDHLHKIPVKKEERWAEVRLMEVTQPNVAVEFIKKFHDQVAEYDWKKMSRYHNPAAPPAYFEISLEKVK